MGVDNICYNGDPILLVFDGVSLGKHEIDTMDGLKIKSVLQRLSQRIKIPVSQIGNVKYNYDIIDKNRTIKDLNLPNGAVLSFELKKNN